MSNEQILFGRPSFPAQINYAHPLSKGLVSCYLFNDKGMRVFDASHKQAHGLASGTKNSWCCRLFASGDYIEATAPHLNFTSQDFSAFVWVNPTDISGQVVLLMRGLSTTDGWYLYADANGRTYFITAQAGANQISSAPNGTLVINQLQFIGFTRAGATGKVWKNAVNETTVSGNHINPLTSARTLKIGIHDDKAATPFIGKMSLALIYRRALPQSEIQWLYREPYAMFLKPKSNQTGGWSNLIPRWLYYNGSAYLLNPIPNFRSGDDKGTIELWFRSSSTAGQQTIFCSSDIATANNWIYVAAAATTGVLLFSTRIAGTLNVADGTRNICDGVWHHIKVSSNATVWYASIDGIAESLTVSTGANNGTWFSSTPNTRDNISVGIKMDSAADSYLVGDIGAVRIYSREMGTSEALTNFKRGMNGEPSDTTGLVFNMPMLGQGHPRDTVGGLAMISTNAEWQE